MAGKLSKFSFRQEQIEAIEMGLNYIEDFFKKKIGKKSALICMPTGSGKTGVFAYITRYFENSARPVVLVLSPRRKITTQCKGACFSSFFENLKSSIPIEKIPKEGVFVDSDNGPLVPRPFNLCRFWSCSFAV